MATVEGNNSTATVYGVSEGSTKLVLSALTKKYGIINYDCVISIYTKINDISGVIKKQQPCIEVQIVVLGLELKRQR